MTTTARALSDELHRISRKKFERRKVRVDGLNHIWCIDLLDMKSYHAQNKGYKYILVAIDFLSKRIYCEPLKNKTGQSVHDGLLKMFKIAHPRLIWADEGKEFHNGVVKELLRKYDIKMYNTYSKIKSAPAERANRTIKSRLVKNFTATGNEKWLDVLPKVVQDYNNSKHSVTGYAPARVTKNIAKIIKLNVFEESDILPRKPPKFRVGDIVRISMDKELFEKSYTIEWSFEYFIVSKVFYTRPYTYQLIDANQE